MLFDIPAEGRGEFLTTAQISDVLVREHQASDESATAGNDTAEAGVQSQAGGFEPRLDSISTNIGRSENQQDTLCASPITDLPTNQPFYKIYTHTRTHGYIEFGKRLVGWRGWRNGANKTNRTNGTDRRDGRLSTGYPQDIHRTF